VKSGTQLSHGSPLITRMSPGDVTNAVAVETSVVMLRVVVSAVGVRGTIAPVTVARATCRTRTRKNYVNEDDQRVYHNEGLLY
jgi:hypothetical protein